MDTYTELGFIARREMPLCERVWAVSTRSDAFTVANSVITH